MAAKKAAHRPMRELLRHPREVGLVVGLTMGGTLAFYTYTVYMQKFLVNSVGLTRDIATLISVSSLFLYMRALGVGLPYALTVSLFGGTAEYVGTWLKLAGYETWFFWYVAGCILCSLLVYTFMRDTRHHHRFD